LTDEEPAPKKEAPVVKDTLSSAAAVPALAATDAAATKEKEALDSVATAPAADAETENINDEME